MKTANYRGSKDAAPKRSSGGPTKSETTIRAIVEASIHTLLYPLRDGPFYIDKITASTGRKWSIPVWKESDEPLRLTVMGTIISTRQTRFRNDTGGSLPSMGKVRAWPARTASLNIHQTSRIGMGTPLVGSTRRPSSVVNGGHPCRAREGSGLVRFGIRFPWLQSFVCFHICS